MFQLDRRSAAWALCAGLLVGAAAAQAEEAAYRYRAPVAVTTPATFVQLPLPASAYGRSQQPGLQDLLLVDAQGERVPFAILAPRADEVRSSERERDTVLYPLPAKPLRDGVWASPIEVSVQGDNISVRRLGRGTAGAAPPLSGGWLIDTGERKRGEPALQALHMAWSGPQEFNAAYRLESSDDLRAWRAGGGGQLLAFSGESGALTQPRVTLAADSGRFVRLVWADAATAPAIVGAKTIAATQSSVAIDPPTELVFAASAAPPSKTPDEATQRALHFDLGGALPLAQIDLRLPPGTRVAPVRVQGRAQESEAWRDLASSVFYRLERGGEVSVSPPLELHTALRYLRLLPDARAAALDAAQTRLVVQARLASLVFVSQGQAPYSLMAGAPKAAPAALAMATLVPAFESERARFGLAALGEWSEITEVARAAEQQKQRAALRPWLLWAVLLAGVGGLAFMVWRLTRPAAPQG
ncbi:MAG: DUF3999 family protein [Burkholderiaceae bacterium]|nr:DUF3999 family protein [Burkholderiaceae bacterium]